MWPLAGRALAAEREKRRAIEEEQQRTEEDAQAAFGSFLGVADYGDGA